MARDQRDYRDLLLTYYEEEIMGEAYFLALAGNFRGADERAKLTLLAKVERRAAELLRPLLKKYDARPRDDAVLMPLGEAEAKPQLGLGWTELMSFIAAGFQVYVEEFEALERMAPESDIPALKRLTQHEVATIDFAIKEIAGEPDGIAPLRHFMARPIMPRRQAPNRGGPPNRG